MRRATPAIGNRGDGGGVLRGMGTPELLSLVLATLLLIATLGWLAPDG